MTVPALREIGEREAIRRLTAALGPAGAGVRLGPGDDAALLAPGPGEEIAVTVDAFVEGRHWRPDWIAPAALGARLAEANLSDLAAMAARPRWAVLSHGVRSGHEVDELIALQRGASEALARHGATVVGGNLSAVEGAEWMSLTLIGVVAEGRAWTRAGARPGDRIAVTGWPGRAGAATRLAARAGGMPDDPAHAAVTEAWRRPRARVEAALALAAAGGVHAAIDVSDGLGGDLAALCEAGGVGAEIHLSALPDDPWLGRAARELEQPLDALRLGPSDDYELLLAVATDRFASLAEIARAGGVPLTAIGAFTAGPGEPTARTADGAERPLREIAAPGFDHFRPV